MSFKFKEGDWVETLSSVRGNKTYYICYEDNIDVLGVREQGYTNYLLSSFYPLLCTPKEAKLAILMLEGIIPYEELPSVSEKYTEADVQDVMNRSGIKILLK